jgi:hypothetical protein
VSSREKARTERTSLLNSNVHLPVSGTLGLFDANPRPLDTGKANRGLHHAAFFLPP